MRTCQIAKKQIEKVRNYLNKHARWQPLDASCEIEFRTVSDTYILRVQMGNRRNEIHLLQAVRVDCADVKENYLLITQGDVLEALFQLGVMMKLAE